MIERRSGSKFIDRFDFSEFIRQWSKGYDSKKSQAYEGREFHSDHSSNSFTRIDFLDQYQDVSSQNRRQRILAYLLNPNLNSTHLILDEALPRAVDNRSTRVGLNGSTAYGRRPFSGRVFFDKFDPHKLGALAEINGGNYLVKSRGLFRANDQILSASELEATFQGFSTKRISSQEDFRKCTTDPSTGSRTLGPDWVDYPEMPDVDPYPFDGFLALKPKRRTSPYGNAIQLSVPLDGYSSNPTQTSPVGRWPVGERILTGSANPARGKLLNSLNPKPGDSAVSLFPSAFSEIGLASDLMPGGGIRVGPYNNSLDKAVGPPSETWKKP